MNDDFRERFTRLLLQLPTARLVSGNKEVLLRCRYCPDSQKDMRSAHMYIKIPQQEGDLSLFNCYKCHTSGIVTHKKILEWGLYNDTETLIDLSLYNKHSLSLDKNRKFRDSEVYRINNTFITDNELSRVKLKYINNRLNTNLDFNDLIANKIVLNLNDLLSTNNITKTTRDISITNQLNDSFIGFISQDNAFINMRNLTPGKVNKTIDKKYINYNIFGKVDNTMRYYTLPSNINLANPKRLRVNIFEGPFDLLSVRYNLLKDDKHMMYSSILGSAYKGIIMNIINTLQLLNIEIHIYKDNDISNYVINDIANLLYPYAIPLYLHTNMYPGEKDFGVPIDRIREQIVKIL